MKKIILCIHILFLGVLCAKAQIIPSGQVIDSVKCIHNPLQSYATYVPTYYSPEEKWPIIYVFDPSARGVYPINIFKTAAEKWGYIVVGSNNSKNGDWGNIFDAADAMFIDTNKRFNIDQNRIYTSGFSGGARAAIAIAVSTKKVRGIIGCGAGSPNSFLYQLSKESKVPYVGIIGDVDMNFLEMKTQEKVFSEKDIDNIRFTWSSGHQWPPSPMIDKAIQWLEYKTNDTISVERKDLIKNNFLFYRDSLYNRGDSIEAIRISRSLEKDIGLKLTTEMLAFEDSKEFKKAQKAIRKTEKKEHSLRERYFEKFSKISFNRLEITDSVDHMLWWKIEIDKLKKKKGSKDKNIQKMGLRQLNNIWAACAEESFFIENTQDYELALRLNEIWLYAEPNSVWGLWYRAKLHALDKNIEGALEYLEKAHENGMSSYESIVRSEAFNILHQEVRYKRLITKLSK